jgi:hypothetical protein
MHLFSTWYIICGYHPIPLFGFASYVCMYVWSAGSKQGSTGTNERKGSISMDVWWAHSGVNISSQVPIVPVGQLFPKVYWYIERSAFCDRNSTLVSL